MTSSKLQSIVDRIERLEEEQKALGSDKSDLYAEAKSAGYNVKALRRLIRERKEDSAAKAEIEATMDAYRHELGMVAAAVQRGEMSLRKAEATSGFSKSSIHRELSHRTENPVSGTVTTTATGDDLTLPPFLRREAAHG
jgi:uncharacterized protein (UPF0335 family)